MLNYKEADTRSIFLIRNESNEVLVIVVKDTDMVLLLIYVLSQLECFLPSRYMNIDSDRFGLLTLI